MNIFAPDEPVTYPLSVKVIALKVVLSLVADALNCEFNVLLISAKTTILALVGVELAVKVSDINVVEVSDNVVDNSLTTTIPGPPSPPKPPPAGVGLPVFLAPVPPPPLFTPPGKPGVQVGLP